VDGTINPLDIVVIVILLISGVLAFMRGFVHEVLSIGAWVGAAVAALYGLVFVQPFARDLILVAALADAAAFIFVFLLTLFALSVVTKALSRHIQNSAFNNLDRSLGFVFGLARAAVILCGFVIVLEWLMTRDQYPEWIAKAKTLPVMEVGADVLRGFVPEALQTAESKAREAADEVDDVLSVQETFERLSRPEPAPEDDSERDGGYTDTERRQLDQLFETTEPEDR